MGRLLAWLAIAAGLGLALVHAGNVFPDEGWYLYAGQMVADGHVPYRDFAHFQAPLGPYVFWPAAGDALLGRLISLAFGLGAIGLALDLARARDREVLVATALLLVPATYTLRWFSVARNIAPAAFFLMLGVWLADRRDRVGSSAVAAAAVALALATGLRLSAAGGLVALVLDELRCRRWRSAALAAVAGGLALVAIFGPFANVSPDGLVFGTLTYHTGLHGQASVGAEAFRKLSGLSRLADHHHLLFLALLVTAYRAARAAYRGAPVFASEAMPLRRLPALPVLTALCVSLLHLVPGRLHPEYHELIVPLLALVAGCACANELAPTRWVRRHMSMHAAIVGLVLLQLAGARGQLHAHGGWSPRMIEEVGAELERIAPPGEPVLTFVPDFALAADLPVLHGLEMASVSLVPPRMPEAEAARLHVVTLGMLRQALCSRRPGAVVWRSLEDADVRRVGLYDRSAVDAVGEALRAGYERVSERHGWSLWRRRPA